MSEPSETETPENARPEEDALPWYQQPWARFAIGFSVLVTGFEVLYQSVVLESEAFRSFVQGLATAAGLALAPFFETVSSTSARVGTDGFVVTVNQGCDGLQVNTLLTAAVLAFPSSWKQKLVGVVLGNLWLQAWNVLRIATLVVVGDFKRDWFDTTHEYIWPTLLVMICLATWMAWARWTVRDDDAQGDTAAA